MSESESGEPWGHEVVIRPEGGYGKEHAELLRKQLLADGFYEHVVGVRETDGDDVPPAGEVGGDDR